MTSFRVTGLVVSISPREPFHSYVTPAPPAGTVTSNAMVGFEWRGTIVSILLGTSMYGIATRLSKSTRDSQPRFFSRKL